MSLPIPAGNAGGIVIFFFGVTWIILLWIGVPDHLSIGIPLLLASVISYYIDKFEREDDYEDGVSTILGIKLIWWAGLLLILGILNITEVIYLGPR